MAENTGAEFLQQKYQLNTDPGVKASARRFEQRTWEVIPQSSYVLRIQNYLDRLNNIIHPPKLVGKEDAESRGERNLSMLKHGLHNRFVIKPEEVPEAYFDSIKRKHREEGHGDIEIPDDYRKELTETLIKDQERSLDNWADYLASDDAKYPDWLKYFAFRSVLRMGRYDKQKSSFTERTGGTVSPFADLNREALAIVLGDLEKKYPNENARSDPGQSDLQFTRRFDISEEAKQKYRQALENKNFAKLYALAIEEFKPISEYLLRVTEGKWVKYPKGSDHRKLVDSIAPYGTGWCIRGEQMAQRYLVRDQYDLHVYYSNDANGNPVVPRVVMVIDRGSTIAEVRGVEKEENLDAYIGDVVETKLSEPEFEQQGRLWKKKSTDMRALTSVDRKTKTGVSLDATDLVFLYEINSPIEGFGYQKDPRIAEIRSQRSVDEDMPIVLGCEKAQIAKSVKEINPQTRGYIGPLEPGIFDILTRYNIDQVYTSFPEEKIRIEDLAIGGRPKEQLQEDLKERNIQTSSYVDDMIKSRDFTTLSNPETIKTAKLKVQDLGLDGSSTTDQIYAKANELGLDLCLPEVAVYQRLKDTNQPLGEWYFMAMKQIAGRNPPVFYLGRNEDGGACLYDYFTLPDDRWSPDDEFVFSLRKAEKKTSKLGILRNFLSSF
ncbi:MAG: hypothetical protein A3F31_02655 [Candidatus Levybacteria bacterium RIFCSPHIGHO2_12_FULL_38_12]|nr:MAG: hypothetical protein A3F31_02655 [Candidatus Levybacteria bacterium RIFCSPHIGHO2_12_FULL_38_12]OGH44232.1 MAG: hypothetical protein A3J14_01620 [Candidatus Levybacteria bacterium RIFCSPLOWO2_02_FULL_37_18]